MSLGGVDGGGHVLDEAVHIHAGGQEAGHVARAVLLEERLVVGVAGDEVHVLVGLLKNGLLPLAEGRMPWAEEPHTTSSTSGSIWRMPAATEAASMP